MKGITTMINYYAQCTIIEKIILYLVRFRSKHSLLAVCSRWLLLSSYFIVIKKPRKLENYLFRWISEKAVEHIQDHSSLPQLWVHLYIFVTSLSTPCHCELLNEEVQIKDFTNINYNYQSDELFGCRSYSPLRTQFKLDFIYMNIYTVIIQSLLYLVFLVD